ncbi:MAG: hypothetical protein ACT4QG_14770 [Sporichthyaceae bacterium]
MNRFAQLVCIHSTWLFVGLVGGAFAVAGWIPPFSPDGSFEELAANFQNQDNVRIAAALFFFGGALFVYPSVAFAAQLRRIEGERSVLAQAQMLISAIGCLFIMIPGALWLAISYYDGVDLSVIVTLNALAWFMLLGAASSAILQNFAIGLCVLGSDGSVYPRWVGYVNMMCGSGIAIGVLIPFFKDGPFAWNGVLGFWVVATDFFIWVFVMYVTTLKAIKSEPRAQTTHEEPVLVGAR